MLKKAVILLLGLRIMLASADHTAKFEIKELEWNGIMKFYGPAKKINVSFRNISEPTFIDSMRDHQLWVRFYYVPVFNDNGDNPGFYAQIFDSANREGELWAKSIFAHGVYDASAKEKDENGLRRWAGSLHYVPDDSIHLPRPKWNNDHFTFMIGELQAWRDIKTGKHPIVKAKRLKHLYYEGLTGTNFENKKAGKIGIEQLEVGVEPIRYQWGGEVWIEFVIKLYSIKPNGKKDVILTHKFDSRNPALQYTENRATNAWEVRDAKSVNYMLISQVYLIPY